MQPFCVMSVAWIPFKLVTLSSGPGPARSEILQGSGHEGTLDKGVKGRAVCCRFKDCTGKSVEMLEREKADKQHLQSQNSAQVNSLDCIQGHP